MTQLNYSRRMLDVAMRIGHPRLDDCTGFDCYHPSCLAETKEAAYCPLADTEFGCDGPDCGHPFHTRKEAGDCTSYDSPAGRCYNPACLQAEVVERTQLDEPQCSECDDDSYPVPHWPLAIADGPSPRCRSGQRPHCTCDICY